MIRLWRNFFVMADDLVRRLEEALLYPPFSKSLEWKERKNPNPFPIWKIDSDYMFLAPQVGLEPTTLRLTAECSAIELLRNMVD